MKQALKVLSKKNKKEIPIFFATDDNYIPFLDVAVSSLLDNASKNYKYTINVLNTGLKQENIALIKRHEKEDVEINFCDITDKITDIKSKLRNVYHFSIVTYYRLFIEGLFPQYDKVLYLDCDIVVLGDISKLYNTNLGNNLVGAIREQVVCGHPVFREWVETTTGIVPERYFNAGILVMNLAKFRQQNIQEKFIYLINTYNFDVIDPDQGYLNVLCKDRVKYLPTGWNKESLPEPCEGDLNLVHYALYKKPWQHDEVLNGEFFWYYVKKSPFCDLITERKANFTEAQRLEKEKANEEILKHAKSVTKMEKTFYNVLFREQNLLQRLMFNKNTGCIDVVKC